MIAPELLRATPEALNGWLAEAQAPRSVVYHVGDLANDRLNDRQVSATADVAMMLHRAGKVVLVQKRRAEGVWEYGAVRLHTFEGAQV